MLKDFPYSIYLLPGQAREASIWCELNLGEQRIYPYYKDGKWLSVIGLMRDTDELVPAYLFHFAKESDYMMFLLRWS